MALVVATGLRMALSAGVATTFHVALDGNDSNNGNKEKPFKTIQKAINQAGLNDTVYIKSGTYDLDGFAKTIDYPLTLLGEDKKSTILTNGGTLTFSNGLTIRNLTFSKYSPTVLQPFVKKGEKLDGVSIENCIFERLYSAIACSRDTKGEITNVNISKCQFLNLEGTRAHGIVITSGVLSNVQITKNTFKNLKSTRKGCTAVVIGSNATRTTTNDILISDNNMDSITGPTTVVRGSGPEVHGILAYGTNVRILKNTVKNLNAGRNHEAIYMKASDSTIADNVVHNCGSGGGGADISSKGGKQSEGNVITGNKITGDQPGRGMLINGGTVIKDNYIKKTNGFNGIDIYAFGKTVLVSGNHVETKSGSAIRLDGGKNAVISDNVVISYEGVPIKMKNSPGTKTSGNKARTGYK